MEAWISRDPRDPGTQGPKDMEAGISRDLGTQGPKDMEAGTQGTKGPRRDPAYTGPPIPLIN